MPADIVTKSDVRRGNAVLTCLLRSCRWKLLCEKQEFEQRPSGKAKPGRSRRVSERLLQEGDDCLGLGPEEPARVFSCLGLSACSLTVWGLGLGRGHACGLSFDTRKARIAMVSLRHRSPIGLKTEQHGRRLGTHSLCMATCR